MLDERKIYKKNMHEKLNAVDNTISQSYNIYYIK